MSTGTNIVGVRHDDDVVLQWLSARGIEDLRALEDPTFDAWHRARGADLRAHFVDHYGTLILSGQDAQAGPYDGEDVKTSSLSAPDSGTLLHEAKDGQLITVWHNDELHLPRFQLDGPRIVAGLVSVVRELERVGLRGWRAALWFATPNARLDDRMPLSCVGHAIGDVLVAAQGIGHRLA